MTPELLEPVISVHLLGAFYVTQPAYVIMREKGYGRIVNTSSNSGILGNFGQSNYGAAKMGLVGFTRVLANEGRKHNIKANAIAPVAKTRMTEELLGAVGDKLDPKLVTPVVCWLASEDVDVTGEIYSVAGGLVSRFFIGLTPGYYNPELTVEDVRDHWDEIRDEDGYIVPDGPNDELRKIFETAQRQVGSGARAWTGGARSSDPVGMSEPASGQTFGTGDAHDFLELDALLDDDERLLRDTVRQFVGDRVLPDVADWFEEGTFPKDMAKEMGALGLLGMHLEGYGCAGTSAVAYGLACLELEAGDSGARSFVSVQGSLAMFPIWKFGSEEQKQEWLPRMAAGEAIGCFGLTEPDSGSDPASMRTRARRDGDDWVLNGTKMWITNGGIADVAVVWARGDADDGDGPGRSTASSCRPTRPGFTANDIHHKLSLRASITSELVLDDVRLPDSARLPEVSTMRGPLSCLNEARYGILWGAVGAARACYECALDYATDPRAVRRADRVVPAHAAQAGRDDGAGQQGPARGPAPGPHEGRGPAELGAGELRQDGQRARGAVGRPRGPLGARRQRHHARVPGDPPHEQPRVGLHLRGHQRDPHPGPGPGHHRPQRLQLSSSWPTRWA